MPKSVGFTWAIVVLLVGLCLSYAVWSGLSVLAATIGTKSFSSSNTNPTSSEPFQTVVPLSGDRFAVVKDYSISVYRVDAQGKVIRTDDVNPSYNPMQPAYRRKPEPKRTPLSTPTPAPTAVPTRLDAPLPSGAASKR